jgi:hypothetical protein
MAGINSLIRDDERGKPLPWSMEPLARLSTSARQISRGKTFTESLEHNAGRNPHLTLNVQLWESTDDVPTNEISIH